MHLPEWQKIAFYILIFAATGYMLWVIAQKARLWMKGRKIDWKPDYFGSVWKYVVGQRKVQASRPKSGAPMHLMLFYGFLALFVATTLLAIASYGPIVGIPNFHRGTYYLIYEYTFDLFGLVFLWGVAWAFLRRWRAVNRPRPDSPPISHSWKDYAALAVLFGLGITGYSVEAARMANNPQPWDWSAPVGHTLSQLMTGLSNDGYVAIWWVHSLLVCVFFAMLPHMRIKHIIIAILSAAGMNPQRSWGHLKKIPMEEVEETGKIGVSEATDFSRWHLLSLDACMECGRCTEVCPANGVGKKLNPKQVVLDIHGSLRGDGQVAPAVSEEALWQCTTCNACVEACPVLIRHVDLIVDARRSLVAEGQLSGSAATVLRQVGSTGSAWGQAKSEKEDWMKGLDIPLCRDGVEFDYLLWVGCAGATDPNAIKTTKAVVSLLRKAGVKFACLGKEEDCTGDPARRIGDEFLYQDQAGKNVSVFERYGVEKIVTACPHCMNTLKNEYPDFGAKIEVLHHTQLLNTLIARKKLRPVPVASGDVTIHDPCYLGRINNESDAPRGLLGEESHLNMSSAPIVHKAETPPGGIKKVAEPTHHGRKTLCCGAGGGRMWMEEPRNQRPGERRMNELAETGANTIGVGCPFCRIMLDASRTEASENMDIRDLAELLDEANA